MEGEQHNQELFGGSDDMFGGGYDFKDLLKQDKKGGALKADKFDDFLNQRNLFNGGVRKTRKDADETVEVREGYDSFTVVRSDSGNTGGRFISKTPYSAAKKAAGRVLENVGDTTSFVLQKTTSGSNKRYYAYTATSKEVSPPVMVFKKAENGDKIVVNKNGQVLRVNSSNVVVNVSGARAPLYNPDVLIKSPLKVVAFDYAPYLIKEVTKEVEVKSMPVPADLQEERKAAMKAKKKGAKTAEQKEKEAAKKAAKKEKEEAKKAAKKEKEAAKKAAKKEKEEAKKAAKKEKAEAKKAKEAAKKEKEAEKAKKAAEKAKKAAKKEKEEAKKAAKKEKEEAKKATKKATDKSNKTTKKAEKAEKAEKKPKSPKAKKAKKTKTSPKMMGGGLTCGINSCA